MTTENTANKLYWQSDLYPDGRVEVQLTLATYADNDNLYVGLICPCETVEDGWEPFTDLTINQFSLPPFHAYVDSRDYNKGAHEFLMRYGIAVPNTELPEWNGFKLFSFNRKKLQELAPEYYKVIAAKLPPEAGKPEIVEYKQREYPARTIKDTYGIYIVSVPELEKALLDGMAQSDTEAQELHESICHYLTREDLNYLTDEEIMEGINCGVEQGCTITPIIK